VRVAALAAAMALACLSLALAAPLTLELLMPALARKPFFDHVRQDPCGGRLSQEQVIGMQAILVAWERRAPRGDLRHLAYMLATAFHETGGCMIPIREKGTGDGPDADPWDDYLERYDTGRLATALGNSPAADGDGVTYAGRGPVMLTGFANYARASRELGIDFIANPDLALVPEHASAILYLGMMQGWFTGKKLGDYFNAVKDDPVGARRIVNGQDRARTIARYHRSFLRALKAAQPTPPRPSRKPNTPPRQEPKPNTFLAALSALFRKPV
jgi:hypothetical protein